MSCGLFSIDDRHSSLLCLVDTSSYCKVLCWGLVPVNGTGQTRTDDVSPSRPRRPEMQTWDEEELRRFLKVAENTPYHALF